MVLAGYGARTSARAAGRKRRQQPGEHPIEAQTPSDPISVSTADAADAYAPARIAARVATAGVAKATLPFLPLLTLAVLAGAFIAFGALFSQVATYDSQLGAGATRVLGGVTFSLGLVLVVVGGAELFTGNNLIVMARCDGAIGTGQLLRNWGIVYAGNAVGAVATAWLAAASGVFAANDGALAAHAIAIATAKAQIPPDEAFFRGLLCNTLVCLAIWLSFAAHRVSGKILAIVFPVSAFVALGFEHSIANMFVMPFGVFLGGDIGAADIAANLLPVTLGNVVGGSLFVGIVYWIIYRRKPAG